MPKTDSIQSISNDVVDISEEQVQYLIKSQVSSMKFYLFYALGIVFLGLLAIYFSEEIAAKFDASNIAKIGGGFVSTLSLFPIKELIKRQKTSFRINHYQPKTKSKFS